MDSLSFDESVSDSNAGPKAPLCSSTPKRSRISRNETKLTCPYCDKEYTVRYYFNRHVESHRHGVNQRHNSTRDSSNVNASQAIQLDDSNLTLSRLDVSETTVFKVPAPVAQKPNKKKSSTGVKSKVVKKPKPKFICTYCLKGYLCSRSYKSHTRLHAIQDAAARFPSKDKILDNAESIATAALTHVANAPCSGEHGTLFKQELGYIVSISSSSEWKCFSTSICEELISSVLSVKHLLPSALLSSLLSKVECILSDTNLCDNFLEELNIPLVYNYDLQSQFFLEFILNFAKELLRFISQSFQAGRVVQSNKSTPELDADDKEVIYYIAGSIMRGYLRIGYRYKDSKTWKQIITVLKEKVLTEKPTHGHLGDAKWTMSVDRGGLLYITDECQKFFIALTGVVFSSEKRDGSIDYEEVIKKVSNSDISIMWDNMISDSLSESNSLNLMNDVICCFCRTCCRGFSKRRLNFLKTKAVVSMPTRHAVASRKKT